MSPRSTITLTLLALALLTGLLVRTQWGRSDSGTAPDIDSGASNTTPFGASDSSGGRDPSSLTAIPPSRAKELGLDDVNFFNGNLECEDALFEQAFTEDELPRFKALLAEFRSEIVAYEKEVGEMVETDEGVSLQIVSDDTSTHIGEWFATELNTFGESELLHAKYLETEIYADLTRGSRTISMNLGKASEWGDEPVVLTVKREMEDNTGSSEWNSRVDPGAPFDQSAAKRYRHVIDIPATSELLSAEVIPEE